MARRVCLPLVPAVALLFLTAHPLLGQSFRHITLNDGLSDQRVQAIAQDRVGFMWFGTANGLNRYDGYNVTVYRHDPTNPFSISGNFISDLYEDRSGALWVGTSSGLNAFDPSTNRFIGYRHDPANPHSLSADMVIAIHEDRVGTVWVGTSDGLNRFDRASGTFTVYRHDSANPRSLSHDSVRAITEDRSGGVWIGTLGGLNRFDPATGGFTVYRHDAGDPRTLSHDVVWDVLEDRAGILWVATDGGGLNRFDQTTRVFTHYRHDPHNSNSLSDDRVDCLFEDATGALWIGTFGGGLSVLDPARQRFHRYRHDPMVPASLSHDYAAEITGDRSGLIWIGTHGTGVDLHDPHGQTFTIYQSDPRRAASLASNNVWAVSEDRDGTLWIGMQDRGLDRLDRQSGRVVHYPPDATNPRGLGHPWVAALEPDRKGALWVGTFGGGLYRLDPASNRFTAYRHDPANRQSLSHNAVTDIHMDRRGTLWVATRGGGVNRLDPATGAFIAYRHDATNVRTLSHDWASAIAEDAGGDLWIGSYGGGLNRLETATGYVTRYQYDPQDPNSLGDNYVWTVHVDRSGVLWVGTSGGLDRFDSARRAFTHYRERDGLASDRVMSIVEDGDAADSTAGNLWIGTGGGISKLGRDRKTFHAYGASDGLPLTEYNRGGCTTVNGEVLMTSIHGLISFNPDTVSDDREVPAVVLTNFLIANKPVPIGGASRLQQTIDQTTSIPLTYADRVISFEFAALNYRAPRQTRYRYRLEGFDKDWVEVASTQRLVTYTNLTPSTYVFHVTAANADGVWNQAERAITLIVIPPWWRTWWFRGLALALIVGCAIGAYVWRVASLEQRRGALEVEIAERKQIEDALRTSNRQIQDLAGQLITAHEEERARVARELHDDVTQQLAALSISLGAVKRRLPSHLTEGHKDLAGVQRQALAVSQSIRNLSHELHPRVLQQFGFVAALKATCAEFSDQRKIEVVFHADEGLEISADAGLCLYRVAQEALRNTARHSRAHRVEVTVTSTQEGIVDLRITDDGRGFDIAEVQRRGGLGLVSIEERVRLVAGLVRIRSEKGHGTEVLVRVPVRVGQQTLGSEADEPTKSAAR